MSSSPESMERRLVSADPPLPVGAPFGLRAFYHLARDLFLRGLDYLESALTMISIVGAISFPLYYWVWAYLFPQPYENLPLRLVGAALFVAGALRHYWPQSWRRFEPVFWYLTALYSLPFFFSFMMLKNDGSHISTMTLMVTAFLLVLLVDWLNLIIMFVVGSALGWLCFYLTEGIAIPRNFQPESIPVLLFVVIFGSLVNYKAELVKRERLRAILAVAGNIAHEMRTPLLAIKAGAAGLQKHLPSLLDAYGKARDGGLDVARIRGGQLAGLSKTLDRIASETDYANVIIDMLLTNAGKTELQPSQFKRVSMADCVDQALARYVFKSEEERAKVTWQRDEDFEFQGSDLLVIHVLFNLMKNALYFVHEAGHGEISIRLERKADANYLYFRDTGTGIAPDMLPHIFEPFYSSLEQGTGTGMGLSFCKLVMQGFGGHIACRSEMGRFTEFELGFPKV